MNGYPSFYPRIALVAPSPGGYLGVFKGQNKSVLISAEAIMQETIIMSLIEGINTHMSVQM